MSRFVFGVVAACWLVSTAAAPAATYYLATDGRDTNAGTKARPWQSLQFASGKVVPGDVVKLKPGVYRQLTVVIGWEGTAKKKIVFEADGGKVTLDGSATVGGGGWRHEGQADQYGVGVPASGSEELLLRSGLSWHPAPNVDISLALDLPLHQDFEGSQLGLDYRTSLAIGFRF